MNFSGTIARGHDVVKRALALTRKNKILMLYMLAVYGLYMLCTFSGIMDSIHGCVGWLSVARFFACYIVAYFVFAALFNKLLAIIKGQQKSVISCFAFEKTTLGQVLVLAVALGMTVWLHLATVGTIWQIGVGLLNIPVYSIGLFTLLIILDQSMPLLDAIKRANRILWRVLGTFIWALIESYVVFATIVGALMLIFASLFWLGYHFALIHVPTPAAVGQAPNFFLAMCSSPLAMILVFVGAITILSLAIFFMVLMSAIATILYYEENMRLRNEQQEPTLPM